MNKITTQTELRRLFKLEYSYLDFKKIPNYSGYGTMYKADVRCVWVGWLDRLQRNGVISQQLANRATLK